MAVLATHITLQKWGQGCNGYHTASLSMGSGLWGCSRASWGPTGMPSTPQHGAYVATSEYNQGRKPML